MRIGLAIYTVKQVSSFLRTENLEPLSKVGEFHVLELNDAIPNKTELKYKCISMRNTALLLRKISVFRQSVALWRFKDRTMSHSVRAFNTFGTKGQVRDWYSVIEYENKKWSRIRKALVKCFAIYPLYKLLGVLLEVARNCNFIINNPYELRSFDVLLIPYGGHISAEYGELVWMAKKLNISTIALQENWDNLSSKTFLLDEPNFFAVWGRQSASHLRSVHRVKNCEIRIIGSPRFAEYFKDTKRKAVVSDPEKGEVTLTKPFILIAGTGDGIDDLMLVQSVASTLRHLNLGDSVDLVYRPHPFTRRATEMSHLRLEFSNIFVDAGAEARIQNHQIPLVQNALVVVNHFSTMTLEALIANRLVIVPLFLGRQAEYRYDRFIDEAHHYIGAGLIPNLLTPLSLEQLSSDFFEILSNPISNIHRLDVTWLCSSTNYGESLSKLVSHAIEEMNYPLPGK